MGLTVAQREARAKRQAAADKAHERYVQRTYGLEPGEYARMLEAQDGRCAICMKVPRSKRLAVDHDHDTNLPRALLCSPCNRGLRSYEAEYPSALRAAQYLLAIAEAKAALTGDPVKFLITETTHHEVEAPSEDEAQRLHAAGKSTFLEISEHFISPIEPLEAEPAEDAA